jgi:6-pyruvoyltetrahydropterin/6-carboxytetrahydropterin synthase
MYYVQKKIEISASHQLELDYESKCCRMHGHNWIITVFCRARQLDRNGMVVDFSEIKRKIKGPLDHQFLNDVLPFNPTAENIARWCTEQIPQCYKAVVQESEGNIAIYEEDDDDARQ